MSKLTKLQEENPLRLGQNQNLGPLRKLKSRVIRIFFKILKKVKLNLQLSK